MKMHEHLIPNFTGAPEMAEPTSHYAFRQAQNIIRSGLCATQKITAKKLVAQFSPGTLRTMNELTYEFTVTLEKQKL